MLRAMSTQGVTLASAREILGRDVLGPEEIGSAFGPVGDLGPTAATVPFAAEELRRAKSNGELLVLRVPMSRGEPLTLQWLIRRFPGAFNPAFLRKVGYQLKDEWGIELEPLAATETCRSSWALVRKAVVDETRNLDYVAQDKTLAKYANGRAGRLRRRTAIEAAFDLIAFQHVRGERLLANAWDWSQSRTEDGGYLNIGHFDEKGLQVFSYSQAVRHGQLGVCPNFDPVNQ